MLYFLGIIYNVNSIADVLTGMSCIFKNAFFSHGSIKHLFYTSVLGE